MTEIKGIVLKRSGERAQVKVDKTKSTATNLPKYLDCWNPINAKPGDNVGIEYQEMDDKKMKMIMYGFPVLGFVAGVTFGISLADFFHMEKLWFVVGGVVVWLAVALTYAHTFKRDAMRQGTQPVIVELEVAKMVIDTGK